MLSGGAAVVMLAAIWADEQRRDHYMEAVFILCSVAFGLLFAIGAFGVAQQLFR